MPLGSPSGLWLGLTLAKPSGQPHKLQNKDHEIEVLHRHKFKSLADKLVLYQVYHEPEDTVAGGNPWQRAEESTQPQPLVGFGVKIASPVLPFL